jgi:hypothetical protein
MQAKERLIGQFNCIADMLLPFAAGIAPGIGDEHRNAYDPGVDARESDPGALEWYGMLRMAAALLDAQSSSLTEKQLIYLQKTFASGTGSFQEFKLQGDQVWANKKLDLERRALAEILVGFRPEDAQVNSQSA